MMTMSTAVREALAEAGGRANREQIRDYVNKRYPGQWQPATLGAELYACTINNPKAYLHHPHSERFLYRHADGSWELYDPHKHGENEWAPREGAGPDDQELLEGSLSLERDLEDTLVDSLTSLEPGLTFVERQVVTDVGRIDILARDAAGVLVVVEIKAGEARDAAVGQIARYLGWYATAQGKTVRGVLVAADFPEGVRFAASIIPNLTLKKYRLHLSFEDAKL